MSTEAFTGGDPGEAAPGVPASTASVETGPGPGDSLDEVPGADFANKPLSDEPGGSDSYGPVGGEDGAIINADDENKPEPAPDDQSLPEMADTPAATDSDLVPPGEDEDPEDDITSGVQQASTPGSVSGTGTFEGSATTDASDTAGESGTDDTAGSTPAADTSGDTSGGQPASGDSKTDDGANNAPDPADTAANQAPPASVTEAARRDAMKFIQELTPDDKTMQALGETADRYRAETVAAMRATLVEDRQPTEDELSAVMDHVAAMREWYKTMSIMDVRYYASDPWHHLPGEEGWAKLYDDMMSEATAEPVAAPEAFAETDADTEDAEYKSLMEKADPADEDFAQVRNKMEGYRDQLAYERINKTADAEGDDAAKSRDAHLVARIQAAQSAFSAMAARRGKLVGVEDFKDVMDQVGAAEAAAAQADEPRAA